MNPTEATPDAYARIYHLENALFRIEGYARVALKRLATQLKRHNTGAVTIPWDAEDIGRILAHIATEAEQALAREPSPAAPATEDRGSRIEDRESDVPAPDRDQILRGPQAAKGVEA